MAFLPYLCRTIFVGSFLGSLGILLSGCLSSNDADQEQISNYSDSASIIFQEIENTILIPKCRVCHYGIYAPHGLSFSEDSSRTDLKNTFSKKVPALLLIAPGQPDSSYLIWKIEGRSEIEGAPMPNLALPLSQEDIDLIRKWVLFLGLF
ncbi:MAG: hypothetical protein HQK83_10700 [Fibrobacteria bacterium]|nr:hypothetical protein [Fibrobacteria bacterium]